MIVRDSEHDIIMIGQHDHANLSGEIAKNFNHFFIDDLYFDDLLFAVYQHDLGWIRLDETPIWNDCRSVPFSFTDYPLLPKLTHYKYGLDKTEMLNKYAGLLCSMHYSSFGVFQSSSVKDCIEFINYEKQRQQRIIEELNLTNHDDINKQFRLLQLCDVISLYICLNEPGTRKVKENSRYKTGFEDSELFNTENANERLVAEWLNDKEIMINPNPFKKSFNANLRLKKISKESIKELGIGIAYKQSEWINQKIMFAGNS